MFFAKEDINEALRLLAADAMLFVPGEFFGVSRFVPWDSGGIDTEYTNTQLPPKDVLFPNTEKMYSFNLGADASVSEVTDSKKQIIFGIRPCDMNAVECMDKVFLEKGYADTFYARKRENAVFIALACTAPAKTCFCDSMGGSPTKAPAADLVLVDNGGSYGVFSQSEKGEAIVGLWDGILTKEEVAEENSVVCTLKTKMSEKLPGKLAGMFEHPIWDEVGRACIGCATCTYSCPTCYCFDIGSDSYGNEGVTFRCWDSCMFSDYTRMAGGHNPRPAKKERVRNRYMHKLSYFNERYGKTLCVGCGRCVLKCPSNMDITEFIDKAAEVAL